MEKNLWMRGGGGGVSRFSVGIFLSHSAEKHRGGTLLCFRRIGVSKSFLHNRCITIFLRKILVSHCRKTSSGNPFVFQNNSGLETSDAENGGGGEVSQFSVVLIKSKNICKGWDSNPYLPLLNPVVLPTVPWEQLEIMTNVSEVIKTSDTAEIRTRTYRFRTLLSSNCGRHFWKIKPFDTHSTANLPPLAILNKSQAFFEKPIYISKNDPNFERFKRSHYFQSPQSWLSRKFQSRQFLQSWQVAGIFTGAFFTVYHTSKIRCLS